MRGVPQIGIDRGKLVRRILKTAHRRKSCDIRYRCSKNKSHADRFHMCMCGLPTRRIIPGSPSWRMCRRRPIRPPLRCSSTTWTVPGRRVHAGAAQRLWLGQSLSDQLPRRLARAFHRPVPDRSALSCAARRFVAPVRSRPLPGIAPDTIRQGDISWLAAPDRHALFAALAELGLSLSFHMDIEQAPVVATLAARYPGVPFIIDYLGPRYSSKHRRRCSSRSPWRCARTSISSCFASPKMRTHPCPFPISCLSISRFSHASAPGA